LDESRLGELETRRAELREQYLRPAEERVSPGRGIHHAALICSDVERTIRFYQDVLGFPLVELVENRDYKGSSHFFFDLGNKTLLGFFDFPGLGLEPGIEAIGGVNLLGIRSGTRITERVLDAAPDLVAIGAFCIGVNQIDVAAASRRGVAVFNAPFSNTRSVVELALAEIISMARRLPEKNAQMHEGQWDKSAAGSHEVRGRKIGIVGYGNIGTQLSVLAENLGMAVYFYDIADKLALGNARRCSTLTELLESVETVTLHVDGRDGNHGFFGAAEFAAMRPRSLFLNLSRGFVVDHAALRRNIESGHIAGAAIDVFPEEPKGKGDEFVSELAHAVTEQMQKDGVFARS